MYIYGETYPVGYDATRLETYENEPLLQAKLSAMSSRNILTMLGDYWTDYYEDTEALKAIHAGAATLLGDELIENLRHVLASGIIDFPFETAGRVNMFLFDAAKAEYVTGANGKLDYIRYVMPELADISVLTDRLFEPSVVLEKDVYFKIVSTETGTEVRFYVDIFQDENVLNTVSTIQLDRRIVLLWGSDVLYKERLIYERYGRFLYKPNDDSRDYHFVIMALQKFYISAKSIKNIEVMINILMGIPYSRYDNETIVSVTEATHNGKSYYRIESDKNVYWAPWLSEVVVEAGDIVNRLDLLARVTTVYDYISNPTWYDKCPFPGKLVVSGTHPDMPEQDEGGGYESAGLRSDSEGTQLEQDLYQLVDQVMKYNLIHIKTTYSTQFSEMTFVPLSEVYTVLVSGLPVYLYPIIQGSIDIEASDQYELLALTQDNLVQDLGIKSTDTYSPTGICKYNTTHIYDGTPLFNYGNIGDYLVVRLDVDPGDGVWEPSFDPSFWTATTGSWSGGGYYEPEQVDGLYHLTLQVIGSWYVDYRPYAMRLRTVGDEMIGMVTVKDSAGEILYYNWELESAAGMLLNFAANDIHNIEIVSSANIDLNFIEFMFKENFPVEPVFSDTINGGFEDVNGTGFDTIGGDLPDYSAMIDAYFYAEIDPAYVDSDLTDFPVAVEVTDSAFFTGMNADSWQYLHATVGGVECSVEVNVWEPENTRAVLWVKVPVVSSTNFTVIEIHANTTPATATGITGDVTAQQVWSNGYIGVYHMADDPAGGVVTDASPSENHGTFNGTVITADRTYNSDAIGYSYNFDGDDSLSVPAVPGANATVDGLFYWTTTLVKQSMFTNGFYYASNYGVLLVYEPGGNGFKIYTGNENSSSGVGPGNTNTWHTSFLTTSEGSTHKAYRESAELMLTRTDTFSGYRSESYIANELDGVQSNFIGKVSEARYSNVVRGTEWLKATDAVYRRLLTSGSAEQPLIRSVDKFGSFFFNWSSQKYNGIYVHPDFTSFWVPGLYSDVIYKYNMPGGITGSSYNSSDTFTDARHNAMRGIWFGNNGAMLFIVSSESTYNISSQNLSIPYDITSSSNLVSATLPDFPLSLSLNGDGDVAVICYKTSTSTYYTKFYSLGVPWDVSTMTEIPGQTDTLERSSIDTTGKNIFTLNNTDNSIRLTVLEYAWKPAVSPGLQDIIIGYLPNPTTFYFGMQVVTISDTKFKAFISDSGYSEPDYVYEYDIEIDPSFVVAEPVAVEP